MLKMWRMSNCFFLNLVELEVSIWNRRLCIFFNHYQILEVPAGRSMFLYFVSSDYSRLLCTSKSFFCYINVILPKFEFYGFVSSFVNELCFRVMQLWKVLSRQCHTQSFSFAVWPELHFIWTATVKGHVNTPAKTNNRNVNQSFERSWWNWCSNWWRWRYEGTAYFPTLIVRMLFLVDMEKNFFFKV